MQLANGINVLSLAVVAVLGATTPARAGQLFAFNYSLPGNGGTPMPVSASGFFATTDLIGASYTITGVWGSWNGSAISGILSPGAFGNNNLLFSTGPLFDINGVGFAVNGSGDDGAGRVNLHYNGTGYTENSVNVGVSPNVAISTATPSPVFFSFSYSMPGFGITPLDVSASGILTAFQTDANTYLASNISGTRNGEKIWVWLLWNDGPTDRASGTRHLYGFPTVPRWRKSHRARMFETL